VSCLRCHRADGILFFGEGLAVEQCAIFVDGGYFAKVTDQNFNRPHTDFQRLSDVLSDSAPRLRTYYKIVCPIKAIHQLYRKGKNTQQKPSLSTLYNDLFKGSSFDREDSERQGQLRLNKSELT